jgi:DNA-directed RNA polymerase subunit E'/Rpb7
MIVSPYKNITQYTKVQIKPHMMNSDIKNNMKLVLRKKVEKICNKQGFIDEVFKIESYIEEDIAPENLSGSVNYNIAYHCRICIPIENTQIIAQVKAINQELVLASNGPIMIFIPKDNINSKVWDVTENFLHLKTMTKLKDNNYIKVEILNKRINQDDFQIKAIAKLIDFATEKEVKDFYNSNINEEVEDNYIV